MSKNTIDAEKAISLYTVQQYSVREVAAELGCSPAGVKELLYRHGIKLRPGGGSKKGTGIFLDVDRIVRLYTKKGMSTVEISRKLGCSVGGVRTVLLREGVQMRNNAGRRTEKAMGFVPSKKDLEVLMFEFDYCAADVARHLEVQYCTLVEHLKKYDIPRNGPQRGTGAHRRQEIPLEEAIQLSDSGVSYQELAERYGVSYGVVVRRFQEAGYKAPQRKIKDPRFQTVSTHKRRIMQELGIESCEICGEDRVLDFCHIKPQAEGGPTEVENTLILCSTHHRLYDGGQLSTAEFKKIRRKVRKAEKIYLWISSFYGGW